MSELTYQAENTTGLEYIEWDWPWIENAPDKESDRILLIGDSITVGYREVMPKVVNGRYFVDGIATSKGVDNPSFTALIDYVMPQLGNVKVIIFNNGLHGWHLSADDYEMHYTTIIKYILDNYGDKKLVISTSTPGRDKSDLNKFAENYPELLERNRRAKKIAEMFNLPVFDIYSLVCDRPNLYSPDGVHLNKEGYELISQKCDEFITKLI